MNVPGNLLSEELSPVAAYANFIKKCIMHSVDLFLVVFYVVRFEKQRFLCETVGSLWQLNQLV